MPTANIDIVPGSGTAAGLCKNEKFVKSPFGPGVTSIHNWPLEGGG